MPDPKEIVINTGPLIALVAATGDLAILRGLYSRIVVPFEVGEEILVGGQSGFAVPEFQAATFLEKQSTPTTIGTTPLTPAKRRSSRRLLTSELLLSASTKPLADALPVSMPLP